MHLRGDERKALTVPGIAVAERGHLVFADLADATAVLHALQEQQVAQGRPVVDLRPSELFALGLLHEISHAITGFALRMQPRLFERVEATISADLEMPIDAALLLAAEAFPPESVLRGRLSAEAFLASTEDGVVGREAILEEQLILQVARANPVFKRAAVLFDAPALDQDPTYAAFSKLLLPTVSALDTFSHAGQMSPGGHEGLVAWLAAPALAAPTSLEAQLEYTLVRFRHVIEPAGLWKRALYARSLLSDESRFFQRRNASGVFEQLDPEAVVFGVGTGAHESGEDIVRYARDTNWMPNVVLLAKSTLVWLHQLSARYGRSITSLGDIPEEELAEIARRGFTALWPIGIWKRSEASRKIKVLTGQTDAAASAYAVQSYDVADELGGEVALETLRERAARFGIRLACDLVPNHWGLDADWVIEHPERFVQSAGIPFPSYRFTGENLSDDPRVSLQLEDGYWDRSDAAVVFKHVENETGIVRYMYHGNDGTSTPWNDTAQLDYLKENVREAMTREIIAIAKRFPIIRFDAAMVLAKQHVRRLWYPPIDGERAQADGGCIASRGAFAMSAEEFDRAMPTEFWRDVADRVAEEAPDTLLLAEAFWMMEGYFVRSLGMHRVYNSAFMNMLRNEDNEGYRKVLRKVLDTDARVLERFVNFMNNPDELPAVVGFGDGNKYFGVCTLLATMPGLPMFGHGQFEGFSEKYGMEYRRALHAETPNPWLLARHDREIVPLLRERWRFSGTESFTLLDFVAVEGHVDEDVLAYANGCGEDLVVVVYNNVNRPAHGSLRGLTEGVPVFDFFAGAEVTPDLRTHVFELGGYGLRVLSARARASGAVSSPTQQTAQGAARPSSFVTKAPLTFSSDDLESAKAQMGLLVGDIPAVIERALERVQRGREIVTRLRHLASDTHEPVVLAISGFPLPPPSADPLSLLLLVWSLLGESPMGDKTALALLAQADLDPQLFKIATYVLSAPLEPDAPLASYVVAWLEDPDARALLGVHEALGRQWFHREAFQRMLACVVLRAGFADPSSLQELLGKAHTLRTLAESAGYEVPKLREETLAAFPAATSSVSADSASVPKPSIPQ